MERKLIGVAAAMLLVCMLILVWSMLPGIENNNSSAKVNDAYIERFFNKDKVIDIHISLSKEDCDEMLQNPKKEEYKQADVTIDGEKVTNAGFRIKGNSSLNTVASSNSERYSFKIDFDQYIDGQNLAGLTKLNLNNSVNDPSYMREYLSYSLLTEMNVPAPAFCYANVYLNDELVGLYLAVEGIEEPFLERYYGTDYGTLYKPYGEHGQGTDLVYTDNDINSYSGLQPVTPLKNGSSEALLNMVKKLDQGDNLEEVLNIDEILRYFAVNTVLVNMDSYQGQFTHNYYLYEENGVFSLLPWDYNMSFGGFGMRGSDQSLTSLYIDQPVSGTSLKERPLLGKLLEVEEYKEAYHQYIAEFINGPFALEKMNAEIERVANMIRPYLEKDPTKFYSMEQFEQSIAEGSSQRIVDKALNEQRPGQGEQGAGQASQPRREMLLSGKPALPNQEIEIPQDKGNRMIQGGNNIGLVRFIRERIDNVSKQLKGELPSAGNTSQVKLLDLVPFGEGYQQPPPGGWEQNTSKDKIAGKTPRHVPPDMNIKNGSRPTIDSTYLYVIAGSIILLAITIIILLKRKNKYTL